MIATAAMRVLSADDDQLVPLDLERAREPYMVMVPMFGVLIIGRRDGVWQALLVQADEAGEFSPSSPRHEYECATTLAGTVEVELLPNVSGEVRLTVVLNPQTKGEKRTHG